MAIQFYKLCYFFIIWRNVFFCLTDRKRSFIDLEKLICEVKIIVIEIVNIYQYKTWTLTGRSWMCHTLVRRIFMVYVQCTLENDPVIFYWIVIVSIFRELDFWLLSMKMTMQNFQRKKAFVSSVRFISTKHDTLHTYLIVDSVENWFFKKPLFWNASKKGILVGCQSQRNPEQLQTLDG